MRGRWWAGCTLGSLTAMAAATAMAQPQANAVRQVAAAISFAELDNAEPLSRSGHPNEYWRYRGLRALKINQPTRAAANFERAAGYGDKYAQHLLSVMYWQGTGVPRDRARAYAWSDLAAERGYPTLLRLREKMWAELDAAEREQALKVGQGLYAKNSDERALPRQQQAMRRALAASTGSRLGAEIDRIRFGKTKYIEVDSSLPRDFYARERWRMDEYRRGEDRAWNGHVIVEAAKPLRDAPADDTEPAPR